MNKEQAIKQIDVLEKQLADTQAEITKLRAVIEKPEKWEPTGRHWYVDLDGVASYTVFDVVPDEFVEFGLYCRTEADASELSVLIRSVARQFQWLKENDDGWEPDWSTKRQEKYFVYYDCLGKNWHVGYNRSDRHIGLVYMRKYNAEKLAAALNSGEVEL